MAVLVDAAERYGLSTKIDQRIAAAAIAALERACRQERPMRCLLPYRPHRFVLLNSCRPWSNCSPQGHRRKPAWPDDFRGDRCPP